MSSDSGSGNPMGSDDDILAALSQLEVQTATKPKPEPKKKSPGSSPPKSKTAAEKKSTPAKEAPAKSPKTEPAPVDEIEEPSLAPAPKPTKKKPAPSKKSEPEPVALPQNPAAVGEGKAFPETTEKKPAPKPVSEAATAKAKANEEPEPTTAKKSVEVKIQLPDKPAPAEEKPSGPPKFKESAKPEQPAPAVKEPPKEEAPKKEVAKDDPAVSRFAPPGLKKLKEEPAPQLEEKKEPKEEKKPPVAKEEKPAAKPKESAKEARELDLGSSKAENRPRENAVVSQRAEGEPQHKWVKVAIAIVAAGALGFGSYMGITSLLTTDVEDDPKPPEIDPGGEQPIAGTNNGDNEPGGTDIPPNPPVNPGGSSDETNFEAARNRLIRLADDAIAEGDRAAYEEILKTIDDPNKAYVTSAAKAERMKVLQHFRQSNSPMNYMINVRDIFNNPEILTERHLTTQNKVFLLKNQDLPWETRAKAAFLLSGTTDLDAIDELVTSIQTDPNLHVVRQAHATFEQITDYRGNLFDVPSLVGWWQNNRPGETPIN